MRTVLIRNYDYVRFSAVSMIRFVRRAIHEGATRVVGEAGLDASLRGKYPLSGSADRVIRAEGGRSGRAGVASSLLKGGRSMGVVEVTEAAAALTARAEIRRVSALQTLSGGRQASLGQFFTPERAAALIADLPRLPETGRFRVLDPGAGSGSLTAALVARVLRECPALELEIVAVEIDPKVEPYLRETLSELTETVRTAGVQIATETLLGDYIELSTSLVTKLS